MNNMITAIKVFSVHNINSCGFELLEQKQIDRKYLIRKIDRHLSLEMFAIPNTNSNSHKIEYNLSYNFSHFLVEYYDVGNFT